MPSLTARLATAVIAATLILAAACGDPTTNVTAPERPSYDGGGYTIGGGHRSSDSTTTTAATSGEGTAESGGYTIGGGH
jgi:hypothetical protein